MTTGDPAALAEAVPTSVPLSAQPTVSLVINTLDRAEQVAILLAALEHQDYPNFEVIVVVGPTEDNTLEVLAAYADRIQVLRCPDANLSRSRNLGLLAAHGEIVAFTDDDAVPCRTWLSQLVAVLADPQIACTGGSVYDVHPAQPALQHRLGVVSNLGEQGNVRNGRAEPLPDGMGKVWTERPMGANMAFRRADLLASGGFDEFYEWVYDDADSAIRLALAGKTVRLTPDAPVYHVPGSSRNRVVRTFAGRWWIGVKAGAYFAVQNGLAAWQPDQDILLRIGRLIHGEWLLSGQLRREDKIGGSQAWSWRLRGTWAAIRGALAGLGTRRLLRGEPSPVDLPILPFLRPASANQPVVDPVSGVFLGVAGDVPPKRVGVVATDDHAGIQARLVAAGAAVHVLKPGGEQIAFQDGAYVHRVPWNDLARQVQRLIDNDGIELVIASTAHLDQLVDAGLPLERLPYDAFAPASPLHAAQVVKPVTTPASQPGSQAV